MSYEVIEYQGKEARLYPDGAIRNERGQFITQHPQGHTITKADASELNKRRYELAAEAIRNRIMENMKSFAPNPVTTPIEAYAEIVSKQAQALYDSDKPRMDDTETLGQIMGMLPRKGEASQSDTESNAVTLTVPSDVMRRLWQDVVARQRGQAVEGRVIEAGGE